MLRYLFALIMFLASMFYYMNEARSAPSDKPALFNTNQVDAAKINKGSKEIIDWILYVAMLGGAIAVAGGIAMSAPFIGKPQEGGKAIKGGIGVIVAATLFWFLLNAISSAFS